MAGILSPLHDVLWSSSSKVYWVYLVFGGLIAIGVYLRSTNSASVRGAIEFVFPRCVLFHASAIADYKIWLANGFLLIVVYFPYFGLSIIAAADVTHGALTAVFAQGGLGWHANWTTVVLYTVADLLAIDAALFVAHYLQHRVPALWEFHKTHHSAEVLTPVTVLRMHPVDQILNFTMAAAFPGFVAGLFAFLFTEPVHAFTISGLNIGLFLFYLAGVPLRHSHIWLMYPRWIARHISSPAMHLIHHSKDPKHADKNLAQMFNFWDRLAGTLYVPAKEEVLELGLSGGESARFRTLTDLYVQPFKTLWARVKQRPAVATVPRHDALADE